MVEDKQLIRQYAVERSETAFAELVRRHLKMVYTAALRQVNGDTHLAEDVAQTVFADFARKAKTLQHNGSIAGWLFVSTRFAAANTVRAESRRRAREQEVVAMNEINPNGNDGWNELRPLIDEALGELGETDRESIVLRYLQGYEFSLVGGVLGVSENAARMRVDRAMDKLRVVLQRRGLATTGAALGAALTDSTGAAVPAQLAAMITSAALAQVALPAASVAPSILKIIAMNKFAGIAIGAVALTLGLVLVVRSSSPPETSNQIATTTAVATNAPLSQDVERGFAADAATGSDAFQKTVQGHDAQVRARQGTVTNNPRSDWEKVLAEYTNSIKVEPGVVKYHASSSSTLISGKPFIIYGWRIADGKNAMVFVTPQVNPNGWGADQVLINAKLIEVPDGILDRSGFGNFKAPQPGAGTASGNSDVPGDDVNAMMATMNANATDNETVNVVSSPQALSRLGVSADMVIGNEAMIAGKQELIGLRFDFFPSQPDNGALMLEMLIRQTTLAPGNMPSESSQ